MPLYDFACPEHGQFEEFARMSECETPQACPTCGAPSPRIFVAFTPRDYLETLVVYQRPDKTYGVLADKHARVPEGCERIEVRETYQKREVEKSIDREHREKWHRAQIGKQMGMEQVQSINRAELRNIMNNGGKLPDGREVRPMSAKSKDFARFAMDQNNNRPREKYEGVFHFEALSQNASNREEGRGRDGQRIRK